MGDMYEYEKNPPTSPCSTSPPSSSSSQDEITLFLRQILLRSSSSPASSSLFPYVGKNAHNNNFFMPGSCNSNASQENAHPSFRDGISALDSADGITTSNRGFLSGAGTYSTSLSTIKGQANAPSSSVAVSENETDDYDCESEEGLEALAEEVPTKSVPSRSSSKRSRAAEVHNLSEKRRRSRINEKMKALQNLIPNSNKTDKASMLDEAIEYLKQLQLQVQMLSMRNGLSLHPMCFPEGLQPLHSSRMRMELGEENRSIPLNMTATLPLHQENPLPYASNLPNKCTVLDQPSVPYPYIINSGTSFGQESPTLAHIRPFQPRRSSEMCKEDILPHQQSNANHSDTNPLGGSQGMLATVSLSFDMQKSALKDNGSLETCISERDESGGVILRNSEPNIILTSQLSR